MTRWNGKLSDTVSVTPDGRTIVDARKLFSKPHIQTMIREMRKKTKTVPVKRQMRSASPSR